MDADTLYDSLDEEFASTTSLTSSELKKTHLEDTSLNLNLTQEPSCSFDQTLSNCKLLQKCIVMSSRDVQENLDISSIVPLYSGDKYKSQIGRSKNSSQDSTTNNKSRKNEPLIKPNGVSSTCNNKRSKSTSKCKQNRNNDVVKHKTSSKSYFNMFNSRTSYFGSSRQKYINDTTRSLFGDSEGSVISEPPTENDEFLDAEDNHSDTTSFYFKQIRDNDVITLRNKKNVLVSYRDKFKSVTETCLTPMASKRAAKTNNSNKRFQFVPAPVLDGLGSDETTIQKKMERRKRQWLYGQKASNRNRIKMVELNVLKNLKSEMEDLSLLNKNI